MDLVVLSAFCDELSKLAAKKEEGASGASGMASYLGSSTGMLGTGLASKEYAKRMKGTGIAITPKMRESIFAEMGLPPNLVQTTEVGKPGLAKYIPREGLLGVKGAPVHEVAVPKHSPELLAHELGHATLRKGPKSAFGWGQGRTAGPGLGIIASAIMASQDPESAAAKWAPAAALAGHAPTLVDEGIASGKALRALRHSGLGVRDLLRSVGSLGKAYGTYGAMAGATALAPYLVRKYRLAHKE